MTERKTNWLIIMTTITLSLGIMILLFLGLIIFLFVFVTDTPTLEIAKDDSQETRIEKIEKWIDSVHSSQDFNGCVMVTKNQTVLFKKCVGYTSVSKKSKLNCQTAMRLASVSKQFTAAAILVLGEQGQLELDDTVAAHLAGFPYENVTIRHLLNMTSGIPDCYMELAEKHNDELGAFLTIQDVPKLITKYPPGDSVVVNETYEYSNTNYVLLAAIVESVSKQSFEDFTRQQLFEPLGMSNSQVWNKASKDDTFPNKAKTFFMSNDLEPGFLDGVSGDGGVFCCLDDFAIWEQFWRNNELVSAKLLNQAFDPPTLANGSKSDYGFGWVKEGEGYWHNGQWLGANTYVYRSDEFFMVILDNSGSVIVELMADEIRSALE